MEILALEKNLKCLVDTPGILFLFITQMKTFIYSTTTVNKMKPRLLAKLQGKHDSSNDDLKVVFELLNLFETFSLLSHA